ncbi:hypothetical protein TNIN_69211, partial [Trichonephila inaurata madagascariensis]
LIIGLLFPIIFRLFPKNIQFMISVTMAWLDKLSIEQKEVMEE